jgi:uncharacterized protein YlxW (UPF0749 family)
MAFHARQRVPQYQLASLIHVEVVGLIAPSQSEVNCENMTSLSSGNALTTRRPDASMTLLTEVMEKPLDPSYAAAAARKAADPLASPRRKRQTPAILIAAIVSGFGLVVAASHLTSPANPVYETRQLLETQINARTEQAAVSTDLLAQLNTEVSQLQEAVLGATNLEVAAQLASDELLNGTLSAQGPGIIVTLHDGGGGLAEVTSEHLVRDRDLQIVVQALWAAGAEAIAIGEQRLTMTTAIRNAGDAVLVDLVPVLGPAFEITAIGDPALLEIAWENSAAQNYLRMLGSEFGIRYTATFHSELTVPGASSQVLLYANTLDSDLDN